MRDRMWRGNPPATVCGHQQFSPPAPHVSVSSSVIVSYRDAQLQAVSTDSYTHAPRLRGHD